MNSLCSLAVTLAISLGGSGAPAPAHKLETVMQDDAEMLARNLTEVRRSARRMAENGVTRVRLTASWSELAPAARSRRRPRFDATDSTQYREGALHRLDRAIEESRRAGMDVMVDLAFFAPRWAMPRRPKHSASRVWRPSAREFGMFARALAERYSGRFRTGGQTLPAVRLWTTWNEPNQRDFLQPQWERAGGRWRPASPHIYRRLHQAAYRQLKTVSQSNEVLIGGLASFGDRGVGPRRGVAPLRFVRELACVDARLRPLRRRDCRGFQPLRADGFAHHPYSMQTAPDANAPGADRVQIGELDKLTGLLDRLRKRGRIAGPLPLFLTEYGYETNPPDPTGVPPAVAARYLGQATFLGWRQPSVRMFPQFLLQDLPGDDYQTGLYDSTGRPKPEVLGAFRMPLYVEAISDENGRREVVAFGQVRPGKGQRRVELQRLDGDAGWTAEASLPAVAVKGREGCGDFPTDTQGFYARRLLYRGQQRYRAVWRRADGKVEATAPIDVNAVRRVPGGAAAQFGAVPSGDRP